MLYLYSISFSTQLSIPGYPSSPYIQSHCLLYPLKTIYQSHRLSLSLSPTIYISYPLTTIVHLFLYRPLYLYLFLPLSINVGGDGHGGDDDNNTATSSVVIVLTTM